jgi:hypothetical protein
MKQNGSLPHENFAHAADRQCFIALLARMKQINQLIRNGVS